MDNTRLHIRCFGKVQSVGFRNFVESTGTLLGLTGTTENKGTNEVETFVEGNNRLLEVFARAISIGPRFSRVDSLIIIEEECIGKFKDFSVIYPTIKYKPIPYAPLTHTFTDFGINECEVCSAPLDDEYTFVDKSGQKWTLCKNCFELT
jgi:acylphosphatase